MRSSGKYAYNFMEEYCIKNRRIVHQKKKEQEIQHKTTYYKVNVQYYKLYQMYYVVIPFNYLMNINHLRKTKTDIFAKGKILTFSYKTTYGKEFHFDAVVDSSEEDTVLKRVVYTYLVPIKLRYRKFNNKNNLIGSYKVKERSGDLTYQRMEEALDDFENGESCSENLESYILGNYRPFRNNYYLNDLFNYSRYYPLSIRNYFRINWFQKKLIDKIFHNEMNTILIKSNTSHKIISLIIHAIFQMRQYINDKILICSSSNNSADTIALELLEIKQFVKGFNLLRIYAKNQEIIKRNEALDEISYHKLLLKDENKDNFIGRRNLLVEENNIIISTCVNSYCDEIINYEFPFIIIINANDSNENENLIPITLHAKHVVLIAYEGSDSGDANLYKRMKYLYPGNHIEL